MDRGRFIVQVKTSSIYKDIVEDVDAKFDTVVFELDRPFPKGKKKSNWTNEK